MPMAIDTIAIVPAGGRSLRMGSAVDARGKAGVEVGGESMLTRVCGTLVGEVGRVIVVAAPGQLLPPLPATIEVVRDSQPYAGPLAAIRDGLAHALIERIALVERIALLASCDLPCLEPGVVQLIIERARQPGVKWAVPMVGGHPQVLVSAVATRLFESIASALAAGITSPRGVLSAVTAADPESVRRISEAELRRVDPTLASFIDIDTPSDLAALETDPTRPRSSPS